MCIADVALLQETSLWRHDVAALRHPTRDRTDRVNDTDTTASSLETRQISKITISKAQINRRYQVTVQHERNWRTVPATIVWPDPAQPGVAAACTRATAICSLRPG